MTGNKDDLFALEELVHSLPPISTSDWKAVQDDFEKLIGASLPETIVQEYNARRCLPTIGKQDGDNNDRDNNSTKTPLMKAIQSKLDDYQTKVYKEKGLDARSTLQHDEDNNNNKNDLIARTYVEQLDAHNCRTGSFACQWLIQPDPQAEREAKISGQAVLHLHYYENGSNQQLRARRKFDVQLASTEEEKVHAIVAKMEARNMSYEDKVAKAICQKIEQHEQEVYRQLQEMTVELEEKLRKLRRILPITKTRFKWNAAAQQQVKLLNDRKADSKF